MCTNVFTLCMYRGNPNHYIICCSLLNPQHNLEDELNVIRRQLLMVCPALEKMPSLDGLITIWQGVRRRIFKHYELATRAYFKFLHLSGSHPDATPGVDDMNVTATLRLLRLLVKYAIELKSELESGFLATPTKPWKGSVFNSSYLLI